MISIYFHWASGRPSSVQENCFCYWLCKRMPRTGWWWMSGLLTIREYVAESLEQIVITFWKAPCVAERSLKFLSWEKGSTWYEMYSIDTENITTSYVPWQRWYIVMATSFSLVWSSIEIKVMTIRWALTRIPEQESHSYKQRRLQERNYSSASKVTKAHLPSLTR